MILAVTSGIAVGTILVERLRAFEMKKRTWTLLLQERQILQNYAAIFEETYLSVISLAMRKKDIPYLTGNREHLKLSIEQAKQNEIPASASEILSIVTVVRYQSGRCDSNPLWNTSAPAPPKKMT